MVELYTSKDLNTNLYGKEGKTKPLVLATMG
jgi:hypothetical protein